MRSRSLVHPVLLRGYSSLLSVSVCATALAAEPSPISDAETTPSEVVLPEMTVTARLTPGWAFSPVRR